MIGLIFVLVLFIGCSVAPVIDTTPPVITLLGENPVNLCVGDTYVDAGATAFDNVDGDITLSVIIGGDVVNTSTVGTYTVTYNVSDSAGNVADEVTRIVNVVEEIPIDLVREYTGHDFVLRWPDYWLFVTVCDTTGKTQKIWDEINKIIGGSLIFWLTDDPTAQIGIEYMQLSEGFQFFVGLGYDNYEIIGCGILINPATASQPIFEQVCLMAIGIKEEKAALGFTDEMKEVLSWLYRLEPGYPLS